MKVLVVLIFAAVVVSFLWAAYDMAKSKKKIHWLNFLALFFLPFFFPLLYFLFIRKLHTNL